jgi:hypothetical protein
MCRMLKNQGYGDLQICMLFNIHMKYITFNTFGYNILKYVTFNTICILNINTIIQDYRTFYFYFWVSTNHPSVGTFKKYNISMIKS